jgi:MFS family permease
VTDATTKEAGEPEAIASQPGSPLARALFRTLLFATLVSNIGDWMEDVGETWLMTAFHGSPLMVALVQSSASLPVFLVALPAGTLADIVDRKRLLLVTQVWTGSVAALLSYLTLTHRIGPWGLLGCTFAMGVGAALGAPAWQAVVADVVPRREVARATMLNGVAFNIARVGGPALGGLAVARAGPGATFALNALSFAVVIIVLLRWKRPPRPSLLPAERVWSGVRTGLRYVASAPALKAILVRTFCVLASASALWALLPSLVRRSLGGSPSDYGLLLTSLGGGAVASAAFVARVRERYGVDAVLIPATLVLAAAVGALALAPSIPWAALAMFVAGGGWLAILTTSGAAVQRGSAEWVRARALAVYLLATEGAMALGSIGWGWLATRTTVRFALESAAGGIALSVVVALARRLDDLDRIDRSPATAYPIPEAPAGIDREGTPVVVQIEYRVEAANRAAFREQLEVVGRGRRRTGASLWMLTQDSQDAGRFLELFVVESWNEHHRQHGRWTKWDEEALKKAAALVAPGTEPKVSHLLEADAGRRGGR